MQKINQISFILILSLLIGVLIWKINPYHFEPKEDSMQYHLLAKNLVDNDVLSLDTEAPFSPNARRTPGYPLFLAGIYSIFGKSIAVVKLIQVLFGPLVCLLVFMMGKYIPSDMKDVKIGFIAAFFLSISPIFIVMNNRLMVEGVFTVVLTASMLTLLFWLKEWMLKWVLATGFLFGCLGLLKPEAALLCVPVAIAVNLNSKDKKKAIVQTAICFLMVFIMVAPWILRNYSVYGKACLISGGGSGEGRGLLTEYRVRAEQGLLFRPERFKYLYGDKWKEAQKHFDSLIDMSVQHPEESNISYFLKRPKIMFKLGVVKAISLLKPASYSEIIGLSDDFSYYKKNNKYLLFCIKIIMLFFDFLIIFIGFIGFVFTLHPKNKHLWGITACIMYFSGVYIVLHGISRYRAPLTPLFILLGVMAISQMITNLKNKKSSLKSKK